MVFPRWLALCGLFAWFAVRPTHAQTPPPPQGWTAARFNPFTERLRAAGADVVLLEGLPHQLVEHSSYLGERRAKRTEEIGGYFFYRAPLPLAPGEIEALRAVCADSRSYDPYSGPKRCGGFHPDYALRWGKGRRAVYTLVCFGCHETQSLDAKQCLIADLPGSAFQRLREFLGKFHAQRPSFKKG